MSEQHPAAIRRRFWLWLACFAVDRANKGAPLHHGLTPYGVYMPAEDDAGVSPRGTDAEA